MSKKVFNMQGGKHSAAAYTELEKWAYGSCVASLTSFVVSAGTGMQVNISTGAGLISDTIARRIATDAVENATVPAASASFNRIDSVIAYIDTAVAPTTAVTDNTNDILKFVVVAGTASASPAAPTGSAIQSAIGAGKPYMVLYDVLVPQNATSAASMTFTDRRVLMASPTVADGAVTTAKVADSAVTANKLASNAVTTAKVADAAITKAKLDFSSGIWGEELARATALTAVSSISTPVFTPKKFMTTIAVWLPSGGGNAGNTRFNNDSGTNYAFRYNSNGGTESSSVSQNTVASGSADSGGVGISIKDIINIANQEKIMNIRETVRRATGAGTNPDRYELAGKWANTSAQINQVTLFASSNNLGAGSEIIVLGHD